MAFKKSEMTSSAYPSPLLIKNILRTPLIYSPEQEIVYKDESRYSYTTFNRRVCQLANMLKEQGVAEGDVVAVMDWDSHRYLECYFAVPMIGAVLHTINIRLTPEQLIYTINHAEDDVILVNSDFLPVLEGVKDQFETVRKVILLTDETETAKTSLVIDGEYEELLAKCASEYDFPDFDENTIATMFYTTGTTGLPKGVSFSHRQLALHTYSNLFELCALKSQAGINSADVYMPITPMFHVHAWGFPYIMTLLGAKQVYPGRYEPKMLLKLIDREKVTFSHCVPTIMQMLLESPEIKEVDLTNWKVLIGGSSLTKELCRRALEHGINVCTGYGMSETGPILTIANLKPHMFDWDKERQVEMRCRTGLPVANVDLKVVDANGNSTPHDGKSTGEVVVRAPWLTQGYYKDAKQSEQLWAGGWLHTGDIGFVDPEGYLQITDRLKDVIKTGGEWVSSLELEDIVSQHEAVSEAAVVGVADEKWGERPLALVVLREDFKGKVSEDDIKDFYAQFVAKGMLPKYGIPNNVIFVDAIPKTSVGKIDKKEIRKQYSSRDIWGTL